MIGRHPRLGFAVVGAVLVALVALGGLVVTAGGGSSSPEGLRYPVAAAPTQVAAATVPGASTLSRDAVRRPATFAVDPAWAARTGAAAGIPATAMAAYGSATLRMEKAQEDCNLSWNTLAGIGWIESHHGTIDGRVLQVDGTTSPPVIGPALNGQGFAAIRSTTESAAWHGDTTWEHAVGPLQFIRSTWARWGSDGDADGTADPMDLDDAAWTAARYLCADGKNLRTPAGWTAAVHSYNHDDAYVRNVAAAANTYAARATG